MSNNTNANNRFHYQPIPQAFDLETAYVMMIKAYIRSQQQDRPESQSNCDENTLADNL